MERVFTERLPSSRLNKRFECWCVGDHSLGSEKHDCMRGMGWGCSSGGQIFSMVIFWMLLVREGALGLGRADTVDLSKEWPGEGKQLASYL